MTEKPLSDLERRRLLDGSQLGHRRACDRALALLDQQAAEIAKRPALTDCTDAELLSREDLLVLRKLAEQMPYYKYGVVLERTLAELERLTALLTYRGNEIRRQDRLLGHGCAGAEEVQRLKQRAESSEAVLDQVRLHCTLNTLAAFEPATDDQATNAGRFSVALYLLKQIHAAVFSTGGTRAR